MSDVELKSEEEIKSRLRELHGTSIRKEMGGLETKREAETLLWVLGYDDIDVGSAFSYGSDKGHEVDLSDYIEVSH